MMKFLEAAGLFQDCWYLYRKYFGVKLDPEEWSNLVKAMEEVYQKYHEAEFAKDLLLAVEKEIEKMQRR